MSGWIWALFAFILIFGLVVLRGAPYVPSLRRFAKQSFEELYPLSKKDLLVDLGSGDGLILRIAAECGATAIGYELNPILVAISKLLARGNKKITTRAMDYWLIDLPQETTIVYAFMVSRDVGKLHKKMQRSANKMGHPLWVMTYGAKLKDKEPLRVLNAHSLYLFEPEPLQRR